MGNLGWSEMLLLMVFALVVFGPARLPGIARQIGKAMREVRKVSGDFEREVRQGLALDDDKSSDTFPYMKAPTPGAEVEQVQPPIIEEKVVVEVEPVLEAKAVTDEANPDSSSVEK